MLGRRFDHPARRDAVTERMKAWQCTGCGRLDSDATCLGVCHDRAVFVVSAAQYDAARRETEELRLFIRQLALVSPRGDSWEHNYRALRERAQHLLERMDSLEEPARQAA